MSQSTDNLMRQFLEWLDSQERTYGDVMECWRTSCPHLPIWEDAQREGLVRIDHSSVLAESRVRTTELGKSMLADQETSYDRTDR